MSTSGINFSGLGSGIDTESIIAQLVKLDRRPQDILKKNQTNLQQRQASYNVVSAQVATLQGTVQTLNRLRAFDLVTATSSDSTVATVTAQTGAQTGQHSLVVTKLAQAQRVGTAVQTSQTSGLGFTGQIIINGKAVNVGSSDTLQTLAGNINAVGAGVTASILSPSSNQYYLTLNSNNSGLQGAINLSDTAGGTFLSSTLGFLAGTTSLGNPISTTGASSNLFADSATTIATLQGQTSPASGTVTIGTGTVSINLGTDSLSAIASKINAAGITGVSAVVAAVTDPITNTSKQQLQISGTQTFTDSNNILTNLGVLKNNLATGRELTAAQDAVFKLDGLDATRASNTFSDAISGVTITLLKDSGATANLGISSDTKTIYDNVKTFVDTFNNTIDTISKLSQYDPSTGKTDPLFGDPAIQGLVDDLVSKVSDKIQGLPSTLSLLSQAGITLDQSNHLVLDDTTLNNALTTNVQGVAALFRAYGTTTNPSIAFVSATSDTKPSVSKTGTITPYAVNILNPAKQASILAATAQTSPLAQDEVLTFGGALFGTAAATPLSGGYSITLRQNSSLSDIISQINGDTRLSQSLVASNSSGKLLLTAKQYGSTTQLSLISGVTDSGSGNTSGIGNTVLTAQGTDVIGTINGEGATGVGQFLTGSQLGGSANARGLQIRAAVTVAGNYGTVSYTSGIANQFSNYITRQNDALTGSLSQVSSQVQKDIDSVTADIATMESQIKDYETNLRSKFSAMEVAVTKIKASSAGLASLATTTTTTK